MKKIKLRLLKTHYLNGIKKVQGNIIQLDETAARLLITRKVAVRTK